MSQRRLIDFDSVLSDTFGSQIEALNAQCGTFYTREHFTDWHSEKVLTAREAELMWGSRIFLNPDFQLSCPPVAGAREAIFELLDQGDELFVVSDRPLELYDVTLEWLRQNIEELPLYLTRSKYSKSDQNPSIKTKQEVALLLGLTSAVDDAPHHAVDFAAMPTMEVVYMLDTPSNRFVQEEGKLIRAHGWEHVMDHVRGGVLV